MLCSGQPRVTFHSCENVYDYSAFLSDITVAILVSQTNPLQVELFSCVSNSFLF